MARGDEREIFELEQDKFEEKFPHWFKEHRKEYGSLSKWANKLGTTIQSVANWSKPKERGGNIPQGYNMARILSLLHASYDDVIRWDGTS